MKNFFYILKFILFSAFFIIIFFNIHVKSLEKSLDGYDISNYLSGVLSLNKNDYSKTYNYLKNVDGLEDKHYTYSQIYLYSLVNLGKFREAYLYSKKLLKKNLNNFESDLLIGVYHLKNKNYLNSKKSFQENSLRKSLDPLQKIISIISYNVSNLENIPYKEALEDLSLIDSRFENIKKIQKTLLDCFYDSKTTNLSYEKLINDNNVNFLRYNFFYANYLINKNKINKANEIINLSLENSPRNLLISQLQLDLKNNSNFKNNFQCQNKSHILSEFFYIVSNALSTQSFFTISNFYINLAKYLNSNFVSHEVLYAENNILTGNTKVAKELFKKLKKSGDTYNWFASKEITNLLIEEGKKDEAIQILKDSFSQINHPNLFQKIEFANYLKNNKMYEEAIKYYSEILKTIDKNHILYPQATDGRGISFERTGLWDKAEKDFLNSLDAKPDQAYVLNYLAYSWIEKNQKIEKSLDMLRKADNLKKDDPYIIDSLGWALFKLKNYKEAEIHLQKAVKLLPSDPIVNDHFADILWINNKKIQARYYWNYVLNLEETEKDMKNKINKKIISGPDIPITNQ